MAILAVLFAQVSQLPAKSQLEEFGKFDFDMTVTSSIVKISKTFEFNFIDSKTNNEQNLCEHQQGA